jgi:hypothetical protein
LKARDFRPGSPLDLDVSASRAAPGTAVQSVQSPLVTDQQKPCTPGGLSYEVTARHASV